MKRRKTRKAKRKFSDRMIRKMVNDYPDNTTRAMSSIALDYDIPYNRVYRAVHKNPYIDPHRHHVRVKSPYRPTKWVLAEVGGMNQRCPYTEKPMSVSWQKIPGGYAPIAIKGWHKDTKRYPHEGTIIRSNNAASKERRWQAEWMRRAKAEMTPNMGDYVINDIYNALKSLKKIKHNDEMIQSVDIKRRPGNPNQAIVIVKHRYYVNGARVYSAGLKTENRIANIARIVGKKTKRIGNSDYVFNIYGINLPKSLKRMPGKLFGNRRSMKGWKIQTASVNGWADVKSSHDGGSRSYQTDYYLTRAEALREMKDFPGRKGSYRVVSATTPAQDDLYK